MAEKLTDAIVRNLAAPAAGNRIAYDHDVKGFGCRVTASGARAFILNYRTQSGRERRYTIGRFPDWKTAAARLEAKELKKRVDRGEDPRSDIDRARNAKTMDDLCDRFVSDHFPKVRRSTQRAYISILDNEVRPTLRSLAVGEVTFCDIDDLHRRITARGAPYVANRTMAVLSKMFTLAIRWGWRPDNPVKGIERNQEKKRHRYLTPAELMKLTSALDGLQDKQGANIIRLLLLTGARKSEVLAARWDQFDLQHGVWTKPGATTKQKTDHRVPLSAPARQLLVALREESEDGAGYLFPGRGSDRRMDIKKTWHAACVVASLIEEATVSRANGGSRLVFKPTVRIHDLRHTYASILASAGLSLPIIGALLGHTQPATTARYAHLMDDPLRQATERAGAIVMAGDSSAEVHKINEGSR